MLQYKSAMKFCNQGRVSRKDLTSLVTQRDRRRMMLLYDIKSHSARLLHLAMFIFKRR